jgi:hypothetical protein
MIHNGAGAGKHSRGIVQKHVHFKALIVILRNTCLNFEMQFLSDLRDFETGAKIFWRLLGKPYLFFKKPYHQTMPKKRK